MDAHFENNIHDFLDNLLSQNTKLFFIVASKQEPEYEILTRLTKNTRDAYVVVTGPATFCGQKNYNLLQGIRASEERDDVYVFLDKATTITAQQLQELVLPLSNPKVTASVGFRWNILSERTLGERLHAFMIALQWSMMNCTFIQSIWGGATAIRREIFEKMGVREYWARTAVDDMSLQHLIQKQRRKAVFVPSCVKETDNTIKTVSGSIEWFKRQTLYVKFHLRPLWLLMLVLFLYPAVKIIGFPVLLGYTVFVPGKKAMAYTLSTGMFIGGLMLYSLMLKRPARDNHSTLSWFLLSPVYMVLTCYAILLTVGTNMLKWRGIAYQLDYRGYVKKIIRN
jgi:ceramide glucosyltransferase